MKKEEFKDGFITQPTDMHIVTTCHKKRAYKNCLCCVCGEINKCTPSFDFYTTDDHGEELVCERCFHEYLGHRLNAEKWKADLNA